MDDFTCISFRDLIRITIWFLHYIFYKSQDVSNEKSENHLSTIFAKINMNPKVIYLNQIMQGGIYSALNCLRAEKNCINFLFKKN